MTLGSFLLIVFFSIFGTFNVFCEYVQLLGLLGARPLPPPGCGSWKINTDAALDSDKGLVGIGIINKAHQGLVYGVALLRGLRFAVNLGVPSALVESDAAVVVASVNASVALRSNFGLVLHDISLVLEQGNFSSVCFAPRECNKATHTLTKLALSLG
ncbi:hypothetical protein ACOSQ2_032159 [Xanthoceras sorbifolium]